MGVDLSRVATKALEAALEDEDHQRRRHSGMRTLAAGAALAVVARTAVSKRNGLVHLPDLSGLRDVPDRLRDPLADAGWLDDEPVGADEAVEDDYDDEDEDADDEDLEDEEDVDDDEEDFDDEPEAEAEEDEDLDEDEDEEPADDEEDEEPPELELESEDDEDLHPEDRPPKPPRSKAKAR